MNNQEYSVWIFLRHMSDALQYLHHQHPPVIHRDLKPDNIIGKKVASGVRTRRLEDCRLRNRTSAAKECIRTVVYNARTQIGTEMWSLGVVMSFYCNRRHLFGNVPSVLRWEGGRSTLVRRHEYSIDLRQLIADLLGPIAHSRPTAIRVLQECDKNGRQDLFAQYGIPRVYYLCS